MRKIYEIEDVAKLLSEKYDVNEDDVEWDSEEEEFIIYLDNSSGNDEDDYDDDY